jgi:hypothetical protein
MMTRGTMDAVTVDARGDTADVAIRTPAIVGLRFGTRTSESNV